MTFTLHLSPDRVVQRPLLKQPAHDAHKYERGYAAVFSGPALRTGASRLAARAALAVGAGVVTLIGERQSIAEHAAHVTAIMLRETDSSLSAIDDRVSALAVGPGAGISGELAELVYALLARHLPIVIDADALTVFEGMSEEIFTRLHEGCILTPHSGEFVRLFPDITLCDRKTAALQAAELSGAIVLIKGSKTVIAAPCGRFAVNNHASPWLATAGSGDILTGLICGLLAQGLSPFDAACIATWIHGDIGVRAGPGLTADTMVDQIPLVLQGCLAEGGSHGARSGT